MPSNDEILESVIGFIGSARGGRKPTKAVGMGLDREITQADLVQLANPVPVAEGVPAVVKLRNSHHTIARLLAEGRRPGEVAAIMGFSASRISILQGDPAFAELVEYYSAQAQAQYVDVHSRLAQLGTDTVEVLQERVLEQGDSLSVKTLKEIAEFALDRSVAPPKRGAGQGDGQAGALPAISITFVQPDPAKLTGLPTPQDNSNVQSITLDLDGEVQ